MVVDTVTSRSMILEGASVNGPFTFVPTRRTMGSLVLTDASRQATQPLGRATNRPYERLDDLQPVSTSETGTRVPVFFMSIRGGLAARQGDV